MAVHHDTILGTSWSNLGALLIVVGSVLVLADAASGGLTWGGTAGCAAPIVVVVSLAPALAPAADRPSIGGAASETVRVRASLVPVVPLSEVIQGDSDDGIWL
jgi:membrane-bound ClpP family serine protease